MRNEQSVSRTGKVELTLLVGEIDDESLKEELETREHFLMDSEKDNERHRDFSFSMDILDANRLSEN